MSSIFISACIGFLTYLGEFVFQKIPASFKANKGNEWQAESQQLERYDCSYGSSINYYRKWIEYLKKHNAQTNQTYIEGASATTA